jgi:plastocyanin
MSKGVSLVRIRHLIMIAATCVAPLACGSDTSTATQPTPPKSIGTDAEVFADPAIFFSPKTVTILQGGTVTIDFGPVAHSAYFDNQPAGAPPNIEGDNANVSKTLKFSTVGTYVYNCHIHPGMTGTVVVVAPSA